MAISLLYNSNISDLDYYTSLQLIISLSLALSSMFSKLQPKWFF